eukprot:770470-Prymnesium_polylepis.1
MLQERNAEEHELVWSGRYWQERGRRGGLRGLLLRGRWVLPTPGAGDTQPLDSTPGELSYYAGRPAADTALTGADPAIGNMFSMGSWPQARRQPGGGTAALVLEATALYTNGDGQRPVLRQHLNMHTVEYATKRERTFAAILAHVRAGGSGCASQVPGLPAARGVP